jgi:hypothetical protein
MLTTSPPQRISLEDVPGTLGVSLGKFAAGIYRAKKKGPQQGALCKITGRTSVRRLSRLGGKTAGGSVYQLKPPDLVITSKMAVYSNKPKRQRVPSDF